MLTRLHDDRSTSHKTAFPSQELSDRLVNRVVYRFEEHIILQQPAPALERLDLAIVGTPVIDLVARAVLINLENGFAQARRHLLGPHLLRWDHCKTVHHEVEQVALNVELASAEHDVIELRIRA